MHYTNSSITISASAEVSEALTEALYHNSAPLMMEEKTETDSGNQICLSDQKNPKQTPTKNFSKSVNNGNNSKNRLACTHVH